MVHPVDVVANFHPKLNNTRPDEAMTILSTFYIIIVPAYYNLPGNAIHNQLIKTCDCSTVLFFRVFPVWTSSSLLLPGRLQAATPHDAT